MTRELELKDLLTAAIGPERRAAVEVAIAEIAELSAEVERLRGIEQFCAEASRQERDGLRGEIERLTTEKELLLVMVNGGIHSEREARTEIERLTADNAELQKQTDYWQKLAISRAPDPKP
jgi:FtsZ-binding cell division protein ZapB